MELFAGDDEELPMVVVVVVVATFVVETKLSVEIIRILDSSERGFRVVVGLVSMAATAVGW